METKCFECIALCVCLACSNRDKERKSPRTVLMNIFVSHSQLLCLSWNITLNLCKYRSFTNKLAPCTVKSMSISFIYGKSSTERFNSGFFGFCFVCCESGTFTLTVKHQITSIPCCWNTKRKKNCFNAQNPQFYSVQNVCLGKLRADGFKRFHHKMSSFIYLPFVSLGYFIHPNRWMSFIFHISTFI